MITFKDSILKFHFYFITIHYIIFKNSILHFILIIFNYFFHSIKSSDSQRNVLFNRKERLKVEIFYTFNRKSKQKYLALSLSK